MKRPLTPTCQRAVKGLRDCALLALKRAREARAERRPRACAYYVQLALDCRRDANALSSTARTLTSR